MSAAVISSLGLRGDTDYLRLKEYVIANTGLAYYADKDEVFAGHVAKRLLHLGLPDCASYLRLIQSEMIDGKELDQLIAMLTIGETFFFRHHEAFDALRNVVFPDLIQRNQAIRKLRIWSAGCSIGAEPYSIAILLKREFGHLLLGWDVSIIATDINREVLERARAGRYEEWAFRSVPEEIKSTCFSKSGSTWTLNPEYQRLVAFQYHNLVKDPCPSLRNHLDCFDLVLCRNVTIYFNQETIRNLVQELYLNLANGGWLLVGHAEPNVDTYRSFRVVNLQGAILYQKDDETPASNAWTAPAVSPFVFEPFVPATAPAVPRRPPARPRVSDSPAPFPKQSQAPPAKAASLELSAIQVIADAGDLEKAARAYECLLEKEKLNPVAHFSYALVLEQLGRRRETQESLRRAIYLDRGFVIAHYYLGVIQQRLHEPKDALRCFRNVLDLLAAWKADEPIPGASEYTVAELKQLTQMHLEALPKS